MTRQANRSAYLLILAIIIFGGTTPILARLAQQEGLPTPFIVLMRLTIGSLVLTGLVMRQRDTIPRLPLRYMLLIVIAGVAQALHFFTNYYSLEYTTVLVSGMMLGTSPIWILLWEALFLKFKPSPAVRYGLILTIAGGIIITLDNGGDGAGPSPYLGAFLALSAALASSFYLFIGRIVRPHIATIPYIWMIYSISAITSGVIVLLMGIPVTGYSAEGYVYALLLTLIAQVFAQSSINYLLGILPATVVSISLRAVNVLSAIYAIFVFSQIPTILQVIGSTTIIAGVIITIVKPSRKAKNDVSLVNH